MKLGFFHLCRNQDLGLVVLSANRGDLVAVLQSYTAWAVFLVHVLSESQILVTTSVLPGRFTNHVRCIACDAWGTRRTDEHNLNMYEV